MAIILDLQALTPPANDLHAGRSSTVSTQCCSDAEPVDPVAPAFAK